MKSKQRDRRRFLKDTALAGLAMGTAASAGAEKLPSAAPDIPARDIRTYGDRSRFVTTARGPLPHEYTPLGESMGILTPASLHFTIGTGGVHVRSDTDSGHDAPDIDPREHRLMIHGMVDRPLIFTLDELKRLPSVSRVHFLQCAGGAGGSRNAQRIMSFQEAGAAPPRLYWKTSCSEWTGVPLSLLLKEAGVQQGASWLVAEGAESVKHTRSVPLEKAMTDVLVAYGQNGEPVRPEQGYPLRLLVPGWEGNFNVKWLRRIKVVDQPYMTVAESARYATLRPDGKARWFQFEMPPHSVITFPSMGQQLSGAGFHEIRGLAWSGSGAIRGVEVSFDRGRTWTNAELQEPVHRIAHTRFRIPWKWDGKDAVIQCRCTDEVGQVQPTLAELSKAMGVTMDYWQSTTNYVGHFNPVQPWKVTSDGSVHNALFE